MWIAGDRKSSLTASTGGGTCRGPPRPEGEQGASQATVNSSKHHTRVSNRAGLPTFFCNILGKLFYTALKVILFLDQILV